MREVMASAPVGDDVYGEDPSVNELQEYAAALFGKEAALFVPSGTLGNQLAIKAHTESGDEVLVDSESHIFHYETAAPSVISGVQLHCFQSDWGVLRPEHFEHLQDLVRPTVYYYPPTRLLCLENTHNRYSGAVIPLQTIQDCSTFARERGIALHCDGARLWNACAASGIAPEQYAVCFDSLSVCLSKGLGAPVGSLLIGGRAFIAKAHKWRKILGSGMRQVGILAAAGRYALEHHRSLLADDHHHARLFAERINQSNKQESSILSVAMERVQTNIVMIKVHGALRVEEIVRQAASRGVLVASITQGFIRAVFHHQVCEANALAAAEVLVDVASGMGKEHEST
jgi:threonine aldolase